MGRKRKQTDLEKDTALKTNGMGHNSALSDDERRALTLHHRGIYAAAQERVAAAKEELKKVGNQAKADLGRGAVADIRDMIAAADPAIAKAGIERALRLARWMGLPVGTQMQLFTETGDELVRARELGVAAGMEGQVADPPRHLAGEAHQAWLAGWHDGQGELASAFKKLGHADTPVPPAAHQEAAQAAQ